MKLFIWIELVFDNVANLKSRDENILPRILHYIYKNY